MTDFIRNILVNAAANANANANTSNPTVNDVKAELSKPVNQIQIPAAVVVQPPTALAVEKQRMIKVEMPEPTTSTSPTAVSADAGKAQRAARRDVVNARRDKRKAMAQSSAPTPTSPLGQTSGCSSESDDDFDNDVDDKSKKMKTGKTSSVAVVGGLAVSGQRPSISSTMPPTPGLLFTPEIDAAGEERLRAMEAQLETLDPDSKEAKKKRRLIRNRMSAQLHRERKKAYVGQLEDQLMEKDRELKLLQEKLAKLMEVTEKTKQVSAPPTPTPTPTPTLAPQTQTQVEPAHTTTILDDEIVIKEEPQTWDSPWAMDSADTWALDGLEDSEMAALETADLLRDFDDPFAGLGSTEYADLCKPQHEIHAAKKNLAMMAAVMFSVSFFGNSPSFYNVTPGSNFSSMFGAQAAAKDLSQMSIASRIVACLEKTSWKEFRDVSTWLSAQTAAATTTTADESDSSAPTPTNVVASPSAASDITDTDENLDVAMDDDTDLLDQFEYPVEDSVLASAASGDWLRDVAPKTELESSASASASLTSRLYAKLTTLWREKSQVLLTVRDDKQQVLQRSVADMSSIREGLESGNLLASVLGDKSGANGVEPTQDQSVTFLYPMSALSALPIATTDASVLASNDADPMFLEVSCQLNGAAAMM